MAMPMFGERPLKGMSDDQLLDWIAYYIGFSEWVDESGSVDSGITATMYHIDEELELRELARPGPRPFDPLNDGDPGSLSASRYSRFNVPDDPNRVESEWERAGRLYNEKVLPGYEVNTPEAIELKAKRWLRNLGALLELDETGHVCKVNLRATQITDAGLVHLAGLTNLKGPDTVRGQRIDGNQTSHAHTREVGALQQAQQSGRETVRSQCETVQHGDGESTNVPFPKPLSAVNLSDDKRPGASGSKSSGGGTRRGAVFFGKGTPFPSGWCKIGCSAGRSTLGHRSLA